MARNYQPFYLEDYDTPLNGDALGNNIGGTAADEVINGLAGNDSLDSSGGGIDTLNGDDSVTAATGADNLRGDNGDDLLVGRGGNDLLTGGAGADTLKGGTGQDTLTGNSGQDVFVFETAAGTPDVLPDRICDFEAAGIGKGDIIDLSAIDADGGNGNQNAFIFNATGQAGLSVVDDAFGNTLVRMNIDGDARFEAVVLITDGGVLAASYTVADFIL